MVSDCWSDEDYQHVLGQVKHYLWLYVHEGASIEELENAVQNLTRLDGKDLDYLSVVHFLLSDEVKILIEAISRILRRLSHSTQTEVVANKGFVKGRIDWNLTIKERYAQGYNPTIFVCRPPSRVYDLPENQLLKFLLVHMKRMIEQTASLQKIEEKDIRLEELKTEEREKWTERVSWLKFHINNALKHVYLREVKLPDQVNERMIRRARLSRNKDYENIVNSYSLHRKIVQKSDAKALRELIERRVLEPLEKDTLYELYVLFEVMDSLGKPEELNLVRPGAKSIGSFKINGATIRVHFQRVRGLFKVSKYKQIFDDYELDVSSRRPDIILQFEKEPKFMIIEVKRTTNRDYIVDSVYKVLGYLADFEKFFTLKQKPKGVLVVWNIERKRKTEQDVSILAHNKIAGFIKETVDMRGSTFR